MTNIQTAEQLTELVRENKLNVDGNLLLDVELIDRNLTIQVTGHIEFKKFASVKSIEAGWGIKASYVFSFTFEIKTKSLVTKILPFWRGFYAAMPVMSEFASAILDEDKCWNALRELTKPKAVEICAWGGWHPHIRAHLEIFYGLKKRVDLSGDNESTAATTEDCTPANIL